MKVKYSPLPPAVVVHSLAEALAAAAPGLPVTLLSGPAAALYAGAGWWLAVVASVRRAHPHRAALADVLDCGDAPGLALQALHDGQRLLYLAPGPAWALVAARAAAAGGELLAVRPPALDMAALDMAELDMAQPGIAAPAGQRRLIAWLSAPGRK